MKKALFSIAAVMLVGALAQAQQPYPYYQPAVPVQVQTIVVTAPVMYTLSNGQTYQFMCPAPAPVAPVAVQPRQCTATVNYSLFGNTYELNAVGRSASGSDAEAITDLIQSCKDLYKQTGVVSDATAAGVCNSLAPGDVTTKCSSY